MTRPGRSSGDPGKVFFGHPRGLRTIVITEAWERFAQYGMQTLLVLYLVGTLLQPQTAPRLPGSKIFTKLGLA